MTSIAPIISDRAPTWVGLMAALTVIHQTARLFAGRMLSARDAADAFGALTRALEGLVNRPGA